MIGSQPRPQPQALRMREMDCRPFPRSSFFRSWARACQHICDHLLTPPESSAWAVFFHEGYGRLFVARSRERFETARQMWKDRGASAQPLYDEWREICRSELESAMRAGTFWESGPDRALLGESGVLVFVNVKYVRSALLPGLGSRQVVAQVRAAEAELSDSALVACRQKDPLPRQRAGEATSTKEADAQPTRPARYGLGMRRRALAAEADAAFARLRAGLRSHHVVRAFRMGT